MGADRGVCELAPQASSRFVHVAAGSYVMAALNLCHHVSLDGAGENETTIQGGVLGLRSAATLSHVTVTGAIGGGVRIAPGESPEISHCTITGNVNIDDGGGLRMYRASSPTVTHCTISGNWADEQGGGVFARNSSPTFSDCRITGNFATRIGGGAEMDSATVVNCTISGNYAGRQGGGLWIRSGVAVTNCAIWGNTSRAKRSRWRRFLSSVSSEAPSRAPHR